MRRGLPARSHFHDNLSASMSSVAFLLFTFFQILLLIFPLLTNYLPRQSELLFREGVLLLGILTNFLAHLIELFLYVFCFAHFILLFSLNSASASSRPR